MPAPDGIKPDYLTREQALGQNLIQITELNAEGSVPELKLKNLGKKSFLIIEGEELVEGDRILVYPLLERKKKDIRIRLVSIGFPGEDRKEHIK